MAQMHALQSRLHGEMAQMRQACAALRGGRDAAEAARLWEAAAAAGHAAAAYNLGGLLLRGSGEDEGEGVGGGCVARDVDRALIWLHKAAELGDEGAGAVLRRIQKEGEPTSVSAQQEKLQLQMYGGGTDDGRR